MTDNTTHSQRSRRAILWSYVRPHRKTLAFALVLGLGASAVNLANPLATRWVLDSLSAAELNLVPPLAALTSLMILGALLHWWQAITLGSLAETIVYDARSSMIHRYLTGKVLPLTSRPAGELTTRVTSDSVLLREASSASLVELIDGTIMLIGSLILMAVLDPILVLTTAITIGIVVGIFIRMTPAIARAEQQGQDALGVLGGQLQATLRAIKTVKAAGAQGRQETKLLGLATESRKQGIIAVRRRALTGATAMTGVQIALMIILSAGAWRVALGDMTVSTLVAFLLYALGIVGPIEQISGSITRLQSGMAAAGRIQELEDIDFERTHADAAASTSESGDTIVEFDQVTARYAPGGAPILDGVSLAVPRVGHTAIVGPSGAGKTTMLSAMLDFIQPEHGELRLNGTPYPGLAPDEIRAHFAYVEQETPTLPGTLRDNLTLANPGATPEDIDTVLKTVRLDEHVATLPQGLDTELTDTNVSGGQRQRIALARALLAKPDILLLDEVTAQLDGISEGAIHDAITDYATRHAVVTVAHRLSTVVDADNIAVMQAGRIIAQGTHHQLMTDNPLYQQLVAALSLDK